MTVYKTITMFALQLKHKFSCFTVNKLFRDEKQQVIVGHEDGMVRTYEVPDNNRFLQHPKSIDCYETKGGPIQVVLVEDLTNLFANDLIVGDSKGFVTLFCKEQIMARNNIFEHCISNMIPVKDAAGAIGVLACDVEGTICLFDPYDELWRMRHSEEMSVKVKVTCVYHATLNTPHGSQVGYTLVADDSKRLLFYSKNTTVLILDTPSIVTAMCAGKFVDEEHFEGSQDKSKRNTSPFGTQVILGMDDGSLHVMANFQVFKDELINVQFQVRHLQRKKSQKGLDAVVVAGNADCYCVVENGKEMVRQRTPSWVTSLLVKDIDGDDNEEITFSCRDLSIQAHKITNH